MSTFARRNPAQNSVWDRLGKLDNNAHPHGFPQLQLLGLANRETKRAMVPNRHYDLGLKSGLLSLNVNPDATGTFSAYEKPGAPFQRYLSYRDKSGLYVLDVQEILPLAVGMKDAVIVLNQAVDSSGRPLITCEDKGNREFLMAVREKSGARLIEEFPGEDGWFLAENDFVIPAGQKVEKMLPGARYLARAEDGPHLGFVVRDKTTTSYEWRYIDMERSLSERVGGLLADAETAKLLEQIYLDQNSQATKMRQLVLEISPAISDSKTGLHKILELFERLRKSDAQEEMGKKTVRGSILLNTGQFSLQNLVNIADMARPYLDPKATARQVSQKQFQLSRERAEEILLQPDSLLKEIISTSDAILKLVKFYSRLASLKADDGEVVDALASVLPQFVKVADKIKAASASQP